MLATPEAELVLSGGRDANESTIMRVSERALENEATGFCRKEYGCSSRD
jgi:hypothetical protein